MDSTDFIPTYLYIKQHSLTKKCYFGKTIQDPLTYNGSGILWTKHIRKHGVKFIETLWVKLFTDKLECTRVALLFSEQQDIVKSKLWLNLMPENGIGGRPEGILNSKETRNKISTKAKGRTPWNKGKPHTLETRIKISNRTIGRTPHNIGVPMSQVARDNLRNKANGRRVSEEGRRNMSVAQLNRAITHRGIKRATLTCTVCGKTGGNANMKRYHFEKCGEHTEKLKRITCPHCNKEGGTNNMKRYHFDNCKMKVKE